MKQDIQTLKGLIEICSQCKEGAKAFKMASGGELGAYSCDATFCPSFYDRPQYVLVTKEQAELLGYNADIQITK